jgi:cytoskeleton protein RodZ
MDSSLSIGETLRRRREERALTPEQAAFQSKVPLRLVQMLESDDYQLLPDPLYLVRLLHEYATFLGLDAAALDAEFQRVMHRPPRPAAAPAPAPVAPRTASTIPWKQVLWTVAAILVATPLVVIALSLASKRSADQAVSTPPGELKVERPAAGGRAVDAPAQRSESAAAVGSPPPALPETTVTPVVTTPAAPGAHRQGAAGHLLMVRAQEVTWLSVRADEKDAREVLLQPEQVARFEAQAGFRVTVGNAGGVTLSLDGTPLPPLGRSGEVVRDLVLPPVRRDSPPSGAPLAVPAR